MDSVSQILQVEQHVTVTITQGTPMREEYAFELQSRCACRGGCGPDKGCGPFCLSVVGLLLLGLGYLLLGMAYNYFTQGATTFEVPPPLAGSPLFPVKIVF